MLDQRILRLLPFSACLITLVVLGFALYGPDVHPFRVSRLQLGDLVPSWWHSSSFGNDGLPFISGTKGMDDDNHPIVQLIQKADEEFNAFLKKETKDLVAAAQRYRERRGRHPPPGFDKWWKYATDNNVVMVEDFWDQIYHDLNPFWALDQKDMLDTVRGHMSMFKLRNGTATHNSDHFWMPIWQELINDVAEYLPDMDIAMNVMDESRLLIPFEDMAGYVKKEQENRKVVDFDEARTNFSAFVEASPDFVPAEYPWNLTQPIWPRVASVCPPFSEARLASLQTNFSHPPHLFLEHTLPHTTSGYVSNYTLSTSVCHQPDLQGLHGFFIEGLSASTGPKLFPLFGSSKILQNSEILLPAAMYYNGDSRFTITSKPIPWSQKANSLVWRGLASGGRNKEDNWKGFHRHRLVSLLNGTQAITYPSNSNFIDLATLPLEIYNLHSFNRSPVKERATTIGTWLNTFTDVAFNDLACSPRLAPPPEGLTCFYNDYLFTPVRGITLQEQHQSKYLIDVDGNSFSGRYRDFLRSGSLPIKGTLFREWHDSRLVAWKHFVPMDNRYLDVFGILDFFVGFPGEKDGRVYEDKHFENPHAVKEIPPPPTPSPPPPPSPSPFNTTEQIKYKTKPRSPPFPPPLSPQSPPQHSPRENYTPPSATYPNNHDASAQKIAEEGRAWAEKVLRVEDMRIYTYRLFLEYARVMDPQRDMLGWIGDLGVGGE